MKLNLENRIAEDVGKDPVYVPLTWIEKAQDILEPWYGMLVTLAFLFTLMSIGILAPPLFKRLGFTNFLSSQEFWLWVIGLIFLFTFLIIGG